MEHLNGAAVAVAQKTVHHKVPDDLVSINDSFKIDFLGKGLGSVTK